MVAVNYLNTQSDVKNYKAGEVIFAKDDTGEIVYGILDGDVQVTYNNVILDTLSQGDIIGEEVMLGKKRYQTTAIAMTDVTVSIMKRHQFLWLVQQTPTFATQLLGALSGRVEKVASLLD